MLGRKPQGESDDLFKREAMRAASMKVEKLDHKSRGKSRERKPWG